MSKILGAGTLFSVSVELMTFFALSLKFLKPVHYFLSLLSWWPFFLFHPNFRVSRQHFFTYTFSLSSGHGFWLLNIWIPAAKSLEKHLLGSSCNRGTGTRYRPKLINGTRIRIEFWISESPSMKTLYTFWKEIIHAYCQYRFTVINIWICSLYIL
jgi:hypothetical protein